MISFFRFPFEWKTPIGYLSYIIIQGINLFATANFLSCTLFLVFGMCSFAIDFVSDIERNFNQISKSLNTNGLTKSEQRAVEKKLIETCRFHIEVRE